VVVHVTFRNTRHCYRVLLAFVIPFGNGDKKSTLFHFTAFLHKPGFFILPIFALANTAIVISSNIGKPLHNTTAWNSFGLNCWKTFGYLSFSFLAVSAGYVNFQPT
jgi:NhaA family Na+:H+ antiporter